MKSYPNKVVTRLLGRMGRKRFMQTTRYQGKDLVMGHGSIMFRYGAYKTTHPRTKQVGWVPFVIEVGSKYPRSLPDYNYLLPEFTKAKAFQYAKEMAEIEAGKYVGDWNILVRKTENKPRKGSDGTWR